MIQRLNLFLLLTSLLFASCDCNNSDTDNGPRSEEKEEDPKFTFSLGEGLKKEDLSANRPIPIVLKDANFSKHGITTYKCSKQKAKKGTFHFMDANGKPGKRLEAGDVIELKGEILQLVFFPNGKSGKDTISLEVTSSNNRASFEVSLEIDLKEEEPKLSLSLADEVKGEELRANRPIPLVLKDENFSKNSNNKYRIGDSLEYEKGSIHLIDSQGKADKKLEWGDNIELKDGELPLMFVPNGKVGKETVRLLLKTENWKSFDVSLELDLKSVITLEVPEEVKTSKLVTTYLKIDADLSEEYTLKSVKNIRYPLELSYDNGAAEGVWAEIKPVCIGDKFKGGETELSMKVYGIHDKVEAGAGVFGSAKLSAEEEWFRGNTKGREIEFVLEDAKGNEYTTKAEFKIEDISFDIEIVDVEWGGFRTKFRCEVKIEGSKKLEDIPPSLRIVSFKANDGSVVSLKDKDGKNMIGETADAYYATSTFIYSRNLLDNLYFSLDEMPIDPQAPSTILTLKLEGPEGVIKSADLEITPAYREFMLGLRIDGYRNQAYQLVDWTLRASQEDSSYEIEKSGKAAIAFLEEVKFLASQVGDPKLLSKYLDPITLDKIKEALEAIQLLKKRLAHFNEFKGTKFVSPI